MTLDDLIALRAPDLIPAQGINPAALLHAIAEQETGHGARRLASKHEKGYCYGSVMYQGPNGGPLRQATWDYGCLAHSSFGTWQVMFIVASELGFEGDPVELREDAVCLEYVVRYLNRRILGKYQRPTLAAIAVKYNAGSGADGSIGTEYSDGVEKHYAKWLNTLEPPTVLKT
jgi:hypothetical protein